MLRGDKVQDRDSDNINLLNVIESLVSNSDEVIDLLCASYSVEVSVVGGQLDLALLWGGVLLQCHPGDDHGHVATPLAVQSQGLHVRLHQVARTG